MKQLKLLLLLLFSFVTCQKKIDNSNTKTVIDITNIKHNIVGFSDKYDTLSNLNFQEINKKEFDKLKKGNDFFVQTPISKKGINSFLEINNKILQLRGKNEKKTNREDGEIWYSYLGFYPSLNMYAVSSNSMNEGLDFSDFELINKSNGKIFKIISPNDDKINNPVPSDHAKYLAYFSNQTYNDNNSFVGILKIDSNKNLKEYKSFISESFKIHEIDWSGDNWIFIKTSSDNGKTFKYYKSNIFLDKISGKFNEWRGAYHFEASNKDNAKTVFNVVIESLDNISVNINDDGSKESYTNIKAEKLNENKIKIVYNSLFDDEMGIIYLEKSDNLYTISGTPIYMINPGNEEAEIKKIK